MTQPESPQIPVGGGGDGGNGAAGGGDGSASSIAALRRISKRREETQQERCELCGVGLPDDHEHLYNVQKRQLSCACAACAVITDVRSAKAGHKRVPRRYLALLDFEMSDDQWEALAIPVNMAFLTTAGDGSIHCHYPSPAGATESLLTLEGWEELVDQNPILAEMEPDVEALLVSRAGESHETSDDEPRENEYFLVPIDACFELVGLIRVHWRGFSGGKQALDRIADFFNGLRMRADEHGEKV